VLDATPAGRAVYRNLGFEDCWSFERMLRREEPPATPRAASSVVVRAMRSEDWPEVCKLDAQAFGAERNAVLSGLRGRLPGAELVAQSDGRIVGLSLGRDGRIASQIGPVTAETDAEVEALLARALDGVAGPVFIDVADAKAATKGFLRQRGFEVSRPFTRMLYGTSKRFDDAERTFAVIGPEFG